MYRYRYVGEVPTVFISVQTESGTWVPEPGEEIERDEPLGHPLLLDVTDEHTIAPAPQPVTPEPDSSTAPAPEVTAEDEESQ